MDQPKDLTEKRKTEHIRISLHEDVEGKNITTGLENFRFIPNALPELSFEDVELSASFLRKPMKTPFLISSMTGGTETAFKINQNLAEAAQERGWAIGLGSMRAAVEKKELAHTFQIRKFAPDIPVIANIGAVQLNYEYGLEECKRAVEIAEADAIVLHLNTLQEVFQPEGDTDFSHLLSKIEKLIVNMPVPVGVKEVGMGIDKHSAERLISAGVHFIDVAGAGGTSWVQVESYRSEDDERKKAAEAFLDWGLPTSESIEGVRGVSKVIPVIASGGLKNGVDAAKTLALGADLAGFGRSLLQSAVKKDAEALILQMERIEFELRAAMFGIGVSDINELKTTKRLVKNNKGFSL
ncbi:type 2 isopentenyl-diphosphate Delta-isomerase [Fictibacillus phosphorivorans]|uniref:type 2 isopentenyl-diphosphate Delta-isomerase n=1 Tax=Fictibacillus phosphorivorans TaxID=1221500 RepID=UPI00203DEF02|nr:type 2 isopentenyl-diphosphate Delta-isomerase [Fictibacillus phosphorivorans]MCM3719931.1 type 2 isopentenyl-diphosphate Delta-isomerase [Fictibacillus phosphorivorans]MCM3777615.1 type 2 isopentenyl-diphosphate Delta-isomerase [Fictibacillus phosphorivorans]